MECYEPEFFEQEVDRGVKLVCKTCKGDRFEVFQVPGEYETSIRCPECGWVDVIHEG